MVSRRVLVVCGFIVLALVFVSVAAAANFDPTKAFQFITEIAALGDGGAFEYVVDASGVLLPKFGGTGVSGCDNNKVLIWDVDKWVCEGYGKSRIEGLPDSCDIPQRNLAGVVDGVWTCVEDVQFNFDVG